MREDDQDILVLEATEPTRHFTPSRGASRWVVPALVGLVAGVMALAFAGSLRGGKPGGIWVVGALLLFFLGLTVWLVRAVSGKGPVLSISESGIRSPQLAQPLAWDEIDDAELLRSAAGCFLQLQVREAAPRRWGGSLWPGSDPFTRRINLVNLTRLDQDTAFSVVHARLAPLRAAAGRGEPAGLQQARAASVLDAQLRTHTPLPWALYAVVALNALVWLAGVAAGLSPLKPESARLFAWGANSASAVVLDGQYWRLLTATFLHAGAVHIALNLFALWEAGRQVCRWYGNTQFLLIYLGAALAGSALSLHFSAQQAVSVGASGAVFGVLGALLVVVQRRRRLLPGSSLKSLVVTQGIFIAYMLAQGFAQQGIDNAAHGGGLMAGVAMAWLLRGTLDASNPLQRHARQGLAAAGVGFVVLALVLTTPPPPINHREGFALVEKLGRVLPQVQAAEKALQQDARALKDGKISNTQMIDAMAARHIPAYRQAGAALATLELPANNPRSAALADALLANRLLTEMMELEVRKARGASDQEALRQRLAELSAQFKVVTQRIQARAPKKPASTPKAANGLFP